MGHAGFYSPELVRCSEGLWEMRLKPPLDMRGHAIRVTIPHEYMESGVIISQPHLDAWAEIVAEDMSAVECVRVHVRDRRDGAACDGKFIVDVIKEPV